MSGERVLEIVTSFDTLMRYAKELGDARKSGDPKRIAEAKAKHDAYRDHCLTSDRMMLGMTNEQLNAK